MGRGNDAIPTWSGFNYQGKMMLLYVLELINQIVKDQNKDIDAYSVELEKTEDFCIICDSEYKSFHQVKAYLSKDKWNSYSEAMDKLLKHRAESNNPTAKCYLTVAKEIKDWDDASNTVYDLLNCLILDYTNCPKTAQFCVHNSPLVSPECSLRRYYFIQPIR